jgi:hypothetical protein
MWKRLQWGLVIAFVYAVLTWTFGSLLPDVTPDFAVITGLTLSGLFLGITYLIPSPWK